MVIVRVRKPEQQIRQQRPQQSMFKVPSGGVSSCSQQPDSSTNMSGKRSWQEAFSHQKDSAMARETILGLSCGERPQQKPKVPQLTIFYAGAVNVYDNVPEDMVKALMTLAASKSSNPANNNNSNSSSSGTGFRFPVLSSNPGLPTDQPNSNTSTGFRFSVLSSKPGQPSDQPNNNNTNNTSNTSTSFRFPVLSSKPGQPGDQPNNSNNTYSTSNTSSGFRFPVLSSKSGQPADQPNSKHNSSSNGFKFPVLEQTSSVQGRLNNKEDKTMAAPIPATKISPLTGLPQARRASIQRFLEIRKQKQASNSSEAPVKSAFDEVEDHFLVRG